MRTATSPSRRPNPLCHGARIARAVLSQALIREAQFRAQAWTTFVVGLLEMAAQVVPLLVVFSHIEQVNGWDVGLVIAVAGASEVMTSLLAAFVVPNQNRMSGYIREGDLDLILIRPVASQPFAALRWVQPSELWGVLSGVALAVVGLVVSDVPIRPELVVVAVLAFMIGISAVSLVWLNLGYLAFWFTSVDALNEVLAAVLTAGKYPVPFFPRAVRLVLLSLLPLGLAATIPIQVLTAQVGLELVGFGLGVLIMIAIVTRLHWLAGMRRYSSASS
jgi:ABC-2 type transport system permease protein